ncbi:MAG: hypothetical protein K0S80_5263, partial [Neobacillus sp.]|nr:hypothetical protein [Neobacillus sp.]
APGYDVQEEDWLLHIANGRKYYVKHLSPISIENQNAGWQIKYLTEKQHKNGQDQKPSISIGTIYGGAIVGNQSSATINNGYNLDKIKELISSKPEEDQEKLNELIDLVKSLTENNVPVSKGTFGKFSDLLSKHSDIAIFLSQSIMNWLSGK